MTWQGIMVGSWYPAFPFFLFKQPFICGHVLFASLNCFIFIFSSLMDYKLEQKGSSIHHQNRLIVSQKKECDCIHGH